MQHGFSFPFKKIWVRQFLLDFFGSGHVWTLWDVPIVMGPSVGCWALLQSGLVGPVFGCSPDLDGGAFGCIASQNDFKTGHDLAFPSLCVDGCWMNDVLA
jgi:hypothetical protein